MSWNPDDWQTRCMILAAQYHKGASGFQEIPDSHRGDCGLEGFTIDGTGIGYQCYVPEESAERSLSDRLIDKINKDTLKLNQRKDDLLKILGSVRLKRWNLLIPKEFFRDYEIIQHAATKRTETVIGWQLPFIADDFRIVVGYGAEFDELAAKLKTLGLKRIHLDDGLADADATEAWKSEHAEELNVLDEKLDKTKRPRNAIAIVRSELIKCAVVAQNSVNKVRTEDPEGWEGIMQAKVEKARALKQESALTTLLPSVFLEKVMSDYRLKLAGLMPSLADESIRVLANEAVVEWLIACPLNFYPPDDDES